MMISLMILLKFHIQVLNPLLNEPHLCLMKIYLGNFIDLILESQSQLNVITLRPGDYRPNEPVTDSIYRQLFP